MKFRKKNRFHSEVFTASMNDIMFFLMLFFLIISTMASPNAIKLLLPKASGQVAVRETVKIQIDAQNNYYLDGHKTTIDDLPQQLEAVLSTKPPGATVKFFVDKTVQYDYVVRVMNIANKLKVKIVLATEKE